MSIFRVEKKDNYVVLDKGFLKDKRLSWQAKGLLAYMLSMPNDWVFRIDDLKNRSTNGRDSTKNIIKELQENGYIIKEQTREKGKFSNNRYIVLERPVSPLTENPSTENPSTGNPLTENPLTENPQLLNNKELNNKELNNKELNNHHIEHDDDVKKVSQFYQANIGVLPPYVTESIEYWCKDLSSDLVIEAIKRAAKQNVRKWAYIEGILKGWKDQNVKTIEEANTLDEQRKNRKGKAFAAPSQQPVNFLF